MTQLSGLGQVVPMDSREVGLWKDLARRSWSGRSLKTTA